MVTQVREEHLRDTRLEVHQQHLGHMQQHHIGDGAPDLIDGHGALPAARFLELHQVIGDQTLEPVDRVLPLDHDRGALASIGQSESAIAHCPVLV